MSINFIKYFYFWIFTFYPQEMHDVGEYWIWFFIPDTSSYLFMMMLLMHYAYLYIANRYDFIHIAPDSLPVLIDHKSHFQFQESVPAFSVFANTNCLGLMNERHCIDESESSFLLHKVALERCLAKEFLLYRQTSLACQKQDGKLTQEEAVRWDSLQGKGDWKFNASRINQAQTPAGMD